MTDRELMQMALDTLEEIHPDNMTTIAEKSWSKAIEALRAVLAQPEPDVDVCCQDFRNCLRSCTPRGQWIAHVLCGCGDQIMQDDGAECGTCVTARNAVKSEWQGLTEEDIAILWKATPQLVGVYSYTDIAREVEAKLKEKNT